MCIDKKAVLAVTALALALCFTGRASNAADVVFSPTTLQLTARQRNASVVLTNHGTAPVRFEVHTLEWAQGTDGRMKLDPSDELVAFPALLTIDPGQSRTVRVADSNPPSSSERSFRLKITEIPEFQGPAVKDATTITLKSQFLLPVFYRPVEEKVAGAIAAAGVSRSTLSFSVTNTGTVHFRPKDVEVVGLGPGGKPVYNHTLEAWYVLSGGRRDYTLALPPATCASLAALSITVQTDVPLKQTLEVQPSACRA